MSLQAPPVPRDACCPPACPSPDARSSRCMLSLWARSVPRCPCGCHLSLVPPSLQQARAPVPACRTQRGLRVTAGPSLGVQNPLQSRLRKLAAAMAGAGWHPRGPGAQRHCWVLAAEPSVQQTHPAAPRPSPRAPRDTARAQLPAKPPPTAPGLQVPCARGETRQAPRRFGAGGAAASPRCPRRRLPAVSIEILAELHHLFIAGPFLFQLRARR